MATKKPKKSDGSGRNSKGQFTKGNPGKPKGLANKITTTAKEVITKLMDDQAPRVAEELAKLESKDFLDVYVKLAEFVIPKLARVESKTEGEQTLLIVHKKVKDVAKERKKLEEDR